VHRHIVFVAVVVIASACQTRTYQTSGGDLAIADPRGEIVMRSAAGKMLGTLQAFRIDGGVRVVGELDGLPTGGHGIHIHETGRCDPPAFETAGAHYNPMNRRHGLQNPEGPHAGDAPNVQANGAGRVRVDLNFSAVTLNDAARTALWDADGSAIVIHESLDDQKTDPSGNSGGRIACGIVERAD
jgi:Cu-Zn family superoxide dismutase